MQAFVTALTNIFALDTLIGAITPIVPVIGAVLLFSIVYRITKKLVNGTPKGKVKM